MNRENSTAIVQVARDERSCFSGSSGNVEYGRHFQQYITKVGGGVILFKALVKAYLTKRNRPSRPESVAQKHHQSTKWSTIGTLCICSSDEILRMPDQHR